MALNFNTLRKQYNKTAENQHKIQVNMAQKERDINLSQTNQAYNRAAADAYIASQKADRQASTIASNAGMTGGAKERLAVNNATNYNNNVANLNSGMIQNQQTVRNAYDTAVQNALLEKQQNIANNDMNLGQQEINYNYQKAVDDRNYNYQKAVDARNYNYQKSVDDRNYNYQKAVDTRDYNYQKALDTRNYNYQKQQDTLARQDRQNQIKQERQDNANAQAVNTYAATVARFNTPAKCDTASKNLDRQIAQAQKAGKPTTMYVQMKQIVQAQKAALVAAGVK